MQNIATWTRRLRFSSTIEADPFDLLGLDGDGEAAVHARSRFRSLDRPDRFAVYSVHDALATTAVGQHLLPDVEEHTLLAVREFRRVPLHASALGLTIFLARPGHAAEVAAALALFVERAVDLYRPAYLLLARSFEQPQLTALLTGVREPSALVAGRSRAFSVEPLLTELAPMLDEDPEWFSYCREPERTAVAPWAV